jgi:hypothetical protein
MNRDFARLLGESARDRRDLFLRTAQRLGTTEQNAEKDFWVCWTLDALFNGGIAVGAPRLLFKGGTSLSKAFGLIERFSEDIDATVFREDIGHPATIDALERLSGRKRQALLDAIRNACRVYVAGPLRADLSHALRAVLDDRGISPEEAQIELDDADPDGQTLLLRYPSVTTTGVGTYVRPVVRIESGAKSALEPRSPAILHPYVNDDLEDFDLTVPNVTTIDPARTFWDKVVIAHGLRRWFERRGTLRQEGQRVSRHYYDLHALFRSSIGQAAVQDRALAVDCARHARFFFNRPDLDLASAIPGTLAITPTPGMIDPLRRDYEAMASMIFGAVPGFNDVIASVSEIESLVNAPAPTRGR